MKVTIYETVHLNWVIAYAKLLAEEDISVSFITSSAFKNDLKEISEITNCRHTWHFINPEYPIIKFSKKLYFAFKSSRFDLAVLNSVDARHLIIFTILLLFKPGKTLITLHDINNFFKLKPSYSVRTNIRSFGKKLLTLLADGFIVNAESLKDYITENKLTDKPVYCLQPVYYQPELRKKISAAHTIVIPGTVDERRRNYNLVLAVIREMLTLQVPVKWILAGKPVADYGLEIIKKAMELNAAGAEILFFAEEIPEHQFQQIIAESALILSPLVSSTIIHDNIKEVYGESKGSGNVHDAIRHAKPIIVPAAVIVPAEIESSCIKYQAQKDLVEQICKLLTDDLTFGEYLKNAEDNSKKFSKERVRDKFKAVFAKASFRATFL